MKNTTTFLQVFPIAALIFIMSCNDNNNNKKSGISADSPSATSINENKSDVSHVPNSSRTVENNSSNTRIVLQQIDAEKLDKKFPFATATEGMSVSLNKADYKAGKHIVLVYAGKAYIQIDNQIEKLKELSYENNKSGFNESFENQHYKLIISANSIKEDTSYGLEGWSTIKGNINLIDLKNQFSNSDFDFYAEGIF